MIKRKEHFNALLESPAPTQEAVWCLLKDAIDESDLLSLKTRDVLLMAESMAFCANYFLLGVARNNVPLKLNDCKEQMEEQAQIVEAKKGDVDKALRECRAVEETLKTNKTELEQQKTELTAARDTAAQLSKEIESLQQSIKNIPMVDVPALQQQKTELEQQKTPLVQQKTALTADVNTLTADVTELQQKKTELQQKKAPLVQQKTALTADVNTLTADVTALQQKKAELETELQNKDSEVNEKKAALEKRTVEVRAAVEGLDKQLETANNRLKLVDDALGALLTEISNGNRSPSDPKGFKALQDEVKGCVNKAEKISEKYRGLIQALEVN